MVLELVKVFNVLIMDTKNSYNKTMQLIIVSAVLYFSCCISAIKVDKVVESATTTTQKGKKKQ
jgi:hypothetical protein